MNTLKRYVRTVTYMLESDTESALSTMDATGIVDWGNKVIDEIHDRLDRYDTATDGGSDE